MKIIHTQILKIIFIIFVISIYSNDVLSSHQSNNLSKIFELIKNKEWEKASKIGKRINNAAVEKILLSQQLLDTSYSGNDFNLAVKFITQNPNWAGIKQLKAKTESYINNNIPKKIVFNWLKQNPPTTGAGYKFYALSASSMIKDQKILTEIIKEGWIRGSFLKDEQKNYYSTYKKYLSEEDNIKKIDYLLFNEQYEKAKNLFHLVNKNYQNSFKVQIALINKSNDAIKLFKRVKSSFYTPGLVYHYLGLIKSSQPALSEILPLLKFIKNYKNYGEDTYKVQSYIAREYIEQKKFKDAYIVISNHFATDKCNSSNAEFLSGWIALSFLKDPKLALEHFKKFDKLVKTPISKARGEYWTARAYSALNDKQMAQSIYEKTAREYGYSFYGQIAALELKKINFQIPSNKLTSNHNYNLKNNHLLAATKLVINHCSDGLARTYISALISSAKNKGEILAIAESFYGYNKYIKLLIAKEAIAKNVFIKEYLYPTHYKVKHFPIKPELTFGIMKQESEFNHKAVSSANAMGLMQLIESTACSTAQTLNMGCNVKKLTVDTGYNILLGTHHLDYLLSNYSGSYILAIAGYNAGVKSVNKWLEIYGDPRKYKTLHQVIDWLELIPFYETRNYVQRVLENVQIYRYVINGSKKLEIYNDLIFSNEDN